MKPEVSLPGSYIRAKQGLYQQGLDEAFVKAMQPSCGYKAVEAAQPAAHLMTSIPSK